MATDSDFLNAINAVIHDSDPESRWELMNVIDSRKIEDQKLKYLASILSEAFFENVHFTQEDIWARAAREMELTQLENFKRYCNEEVLSRQVLLTNRAMVRKITGVGEYPYLYSGIRAKELSNSPPPTAVVSGLLHRGHVTVLAAPPYTGKSWFSLNIATAVAADQNQINAPWPGGIIECPGTPVLYVSPDFPASELCRRARKLDEQRADLVKPDSYWNNFYIAGDAQGVRMPRDRYSLNEEGCERISNELVPDGCSLVVLDTLSAGLPPEVSENDNGGLAKVMGAIQGIASTNDCAVLLIHHTAKPSKGEKKSEVWASVRGAGAISGSASTNALLEPHPSGDWDNIRVLRSVSNVSQPLPRTCFKVRPDYDKSDAILFFRPVEEPQEEED